MLYSILISWATTVGTANLKSSLPIGAVPSISLLSLIISLRKIKNCNAHYITFRYKNQAITMFVNIACVAVVFIIIIVGFLKNFVVMLYCNGEKETKIQ